MWLRRSPFNRFQPLLPPSADEQRPLGHNEYRHLDVTEDLGFMFPHIKKQRRKPQQNAKFELRLWRLFSTHHTKAPSVSMSTGYKKERVSTRCIPLCYR